MKAEELQRYVNDIDPTVDVNTEHGRPLLLKDVGDTVMIGEACATCSNVPCSCDDAAGIEPDNDPPVDNYYVAAVKYGRHVIVHNGKEHYDHFGLPGLRVEAPGRVTVTHVDPYETRKRLADGVAIPAQRFWRYLDTGIHDDEFHVSVCVWHPTECIDAQYPWRATGCAGIRLTVAEAWALRDALDTFLTGDDN